MDINNNQKGEIVQHGIGLKHFCYSSENIIVWIMRHNIFNVTIQNITQFTYGVYFYILIMS